MMDALSSTASLDPGEVALAIGGLKALVAGEKLRFGVERLRELVDYPKKVARVAKVITTATEDSPDFRAEENYWSLLERLRKPLSPEDVVGLVNSFPPEAHKVSGPFVIAAQRAWAYLQNCFPTAEFNSFAGPEDMTPDSEELWSFASKLWVLEDPLLVFELAAVGGVLDEQVAAVHAVYPTLSQVITQAIYQATAAARGAVKSFHLPATAEDGVATWLGRPIEVNQNPDKQLDSKPNGPQAPSGAPSAAAKALVTPAQKMANA